MKKKTSFWPLLSAFLSLLILFLLFYGVFLRSRLGCSLSLQPHSESVIKINLHFWRYLGETVKMLKASASIAFKNITPRVCSATFLIRDRKGTRDFFHNPACQAYQLTNQGRRTWKVMSNRVCSWSTIGKWRSKCLVYLTALNPVTRFCWIGQPLEQ